MQTAWTRLRAPVRPRTSPARWATKRRNTFGGRVGLPDLGQVVGGEELGQRRRIDLVGLRLGGGDRSGPQRVAHHHPAGMLGQQLGDGPRVCGGLEDDRVVGAQTSREGAQVGGRGADSAEPADLAAGFDDRRLGELAADVESDAAHRQTSCSPLSGWGTRRATRQLRIRARSATGRVAGAANYHGGLEVQSHTGLPVQDGVPSPSPCPGALTIPADRGRETPLS